MFGCTTSCTELDNLIRYRSIWFLSSGSFLLSHSSRCAASAPERSSTHWAQCGHRLAEDDSGYHYDLDFRMDVQGKTGSCSASLDTRSSESKAARIKPKV